MLPKMNPQCAPSCPPRRSFVASDARHRGQLCTVSTRQASTYLSGKSVQINRATSVAGLISARFRDMPQIVSALMQVAFYVTPILFHGGMLSGKHKWIVEYNPLAYLIDIVRQPLVGEVPPAFTWELTIGMAVFGWLLALGMTGRYHRRIPYWV